MTPSVAVSRMASSSWMRLSARRRRDLGSGGLADDHQLRCRAVPFGDRGAHGDGNILASLGGKREGRILVAPVPECGRAAEQMHETALGSDLVDIAIAGQVEQEAVGEQNFLAAMDQDSDRQPVENSVIADRHEGRGSFRLPSRLGPIGGRGGIRFGDAEMACPPRGGHRARAQFRERHCAPRWKGSRSAALPPGLGSTGFGSDGTVLDRASATWSRRSLNHLSSPRGSLSASWVCGISSGGRNGSVSSLTRLCAIRSAVGCPGSSKDSESFEGCSGDIRSRRASMRRRPKPRKPTSSRFAPKTGIPAQSTGTCIRD